MRDFNIDTIVSWQAYSARGRGAYLSDVHIDVWLDLIWNLPLRVMYFLGAPFVWMVSQFRDLLGLLDAVVFLYIASKIALGVRQRRLLTIDVYLSIILVVAGVVAVFALGTSNYGTAFRHRAKIFPWLLLLYLYGNSIPVPPSVAIQHHRRRQFFRLPPPSHMAPRSNMKQPSRASLSLVPIACDILTFMVKDKGHRK